MRPNLREDGWELDSALARHRKSPATFEIPSDEERAQVQVGDMVKLLFLFDEDWPDSEGEGRAGEPLVSCERMWVTTTRVTEAGYEGRLESLPRTTDVIRPGERVSFQSDHIASIFIPETDQRRAPP